MAPHSILKHEDNNEQFWSTESDDLRDDYFGLIRTHIDVMRVKRFLKLMNFNKQIVTEIGTVTDLINEKRGLDSNGKPPPSA